MHSSSQKNLRLCRETGLPTKAPRISDMQDDASFFLILWLALGYPLGHFGLEKVQEALGAVNVGSRLVGVLEGVLDYVPHGLGVLLALVQGQKGARFVEDVGIGVPAADGRLGLLDQVEDGVVVGAVDPVGAHVDPVPVGEQLLVDAAADAIPSLDDGDPEAKAEENVGAAEAGQPGADDGDMGLGGRVGVAALWAEKA